MTGGETDYLMQERLLQVQIGLKGRLAGLMDTIHLASRGLQDRADQVLAAYQRVSKSQGRQQAAVMILSAVIAVGTIAYTWTTWTSVEAMREANEIQRQLLELQKASKAAPDLAVKATSTR